VTAPTDPENDPQPQPQYPPAPPVAPGAWGPSANAPVNPTWYPYPVYGIPTKGSRKRAKAAVLVGALLVLAVGAGALVYIAHAPFGPSRSLGSPRVEGTATTLQDGRVLVAGGFSASLDVDGSPALATAELFDPNTDTLSPTGSMTTPRADQTATLLQDGRVLILGGDQTGTAELYDPKTGAFAATGKPSADFSGSATLLKDGRVLVIEPSGTAAALYDPKTGQFTPTGSMVDYRMWYSATLLADGRVLVAGGLDKDFAAQKTAELYDPTTGSFGLTGAMFIARSNHSATLLPDGRVLMAGGQQIYNTTPDPGHAELYDPATGTFATTGSMVVPREFQTATLLPDGRVLFTGGANDIDRAEATAELYDPRTGEFSLTGQMAVHRLWQAAALLQDGRVLVVGGQGNAKAVSTMVELWDPKTGKFSQP